MATTFTGLRVQDTYNAIIKIGDNSTLTGTGKLLSDGYGNSSNLYLSTTKLGIGVVPTENLHIGGSMRLTGSFKDKNNESGTTGQVLTSTATGTDWKTISDIDGVTSTTGGTANYVPKFTSASNIENSIIQASATLVTISGNLDVNGTVTYIDTIDLSVKDPLIKLANANTSNTLDIGFYGKYAVAGTTKYLGLYSDSGNSNKFRLFTGLESEPTTVVDSSDTTFVVGTLIANFEGDLIGNVTGNVTGNLTGNVTGGTITGSSGTFSGDVAFGTLTDTGESISITKFVDEADGIANNDNDTTIPTSAAIIDYVADNTGSSNTLTGTVKNISGGALTKGTPVHSSASATPPSGNVSEVIAARGDTSTAMPATYILAEDLADEAEGSAVLTGFLGGLDTSSFSEGDVLYVAPTGGYTITKPTGTNLIQNIAIVVKVHATNGSIEVYGSGRSNDVPNYIYRDINFDGGDLKFGNSDKVILGDGDDLEIFESFGNSYMINNTGNLYIENLADDRDIVFINDDGTGGSAVYLFMDGSEVRNKFFQNVQVNDNKILEIGSGQDMKIYHDTADTFIANSTGDLTISNATDDGDIIFQGDNGASPSVLTEYMRIDGGFVRTVFSKSTQHQDAVYGFYGASSDLKIGFDATDSLIVNSTGDLYITNSADDKDIIFSSDDGSGGIIEYFRVDGSESRVTFGRRLMMADNVRLAFGNSNNGQIWYDSTAAKVLQSGSIQFADAVSVDDDFTVTGTLDFPGTAAQYVKGDGALATFPAIPQGDITAITVGNGLAGTSLSGPIPDLTMSGSYTGDFTITGNQYFNGEFIEGDGKEMFRYSNTWLRINEDNDFTDGIYCGTGILRTDGRFEVGSGGTKFLVTAAGVVTAFGSVTASSFIGPLTGLASLNTPLNDIRSLGVQAFTNGTNPNITTAQVMAEIEADGGFDSFSSVFKTSWSYAGNYNLTDAGDFTETAGSSWITWTDNSSDTTRGNITALAIAPTTGGSSGGVFIYNDQGAGYSPGWRQVWTSTTDGSGSGLDADLLDGQEGSYYAPATGGSYLPLAGGVVTGSTDFTASQYPLDVYGIGSTAGSSAVGLGVYGSSTAGAIMHFHRPGAYAVNFGLDSDNVLRIGGWSAAANRWQLDMSGNNSVAGSSTATIFYDWNTAYYGDFASTTIGKYFGRAASNEGFQVGTYNNVGDNSTHTNPIYTIGSSYNPALTTLSNMYGVGYGNVNASFISFTGASDWGFYVAADGDARVWLDASNGAVSTAGSMYAATYYDYNNTGYYLDPQATSAINTVNIKGAITFPSSNLGAVTRGSQNFAIYQESGSWTNPYPDLNIGFHTGISMGAYSGYNGMRFYNDANMVTQVMSINNVSDGLGADDVYVNNSLVAGSSLRAPIFYDSNDTTYFLNPHSTSQTRSISIMQGSGLNFYQSGNASYTYNDARAEGSYSALYKGTNNGSGYGNYREYWYSGATGYQSIEQASNRFNFSAPITAATDVRAPIFYDSNDTSYYINPATNISAILAGSIGINNTSPVNTAWGNEATTKQLTITGANYGVLNLQGSITALTKYSMGVGGNTFYMAYDNIASRHNIKVNSSGNVLIYVDVRAPIFYDLDNTGYYVNPGATSRLLNLDFGDAGYYLKRGDWGTRQQTPYGWIQFGPANSSYAHIYTDRNNFYMNAGLYISGGSWMRAGDIRSAIFYDVNNTTYYLDASTTGTSLNCAGTGIFGGDVVAYSDKKLKTNIKTLNGSKVLKMRGVSFDRIDTGKHSSGVIAQEIQEIAPELVNDKNGTLAVAYGNLTGYLIEAIKDQQIMIDDLKKRLKTLENN